MVQEVECYDYAAGANPETDEDGSFWDYQWCTEQFQPFSKDGENDMYWDQVLPLTTHAADELRSSQLQQVSAPASCLGFSRTCLKCAWMAYEGCTSNF